MSITHMFRSQLLWRLYAGYVVIILSAMLIVGVLVSREVANNGMEEIHHSLEARSQMLLEIARQALRDETVQAKAKIKSGDDNTHTPGFPPSRSLQQVVVELGENTDSRLTVIAAEGRVIADSQESPGNMDNHGLRPEIIDARKHGSATTSRFSQTLQQEMIYRALRVTDKGGAIGFVRVSLPLRTIDKKVLQLRRIVLFSTGVSALAALLLGFYFAKRFSDPLIRMTEVAEAISQGDYNRRISVEQHDEVGKLAAAVNRMARSSALRMEEITTDRNRLAMIFAGMVEGVIGVDENQKIIHVNRRAADLLELSISSCIDKPIWQEVRVQEINQALERAIAEQGVVKSQMRRSLEADDLVVNIYTVALRNDAGEPQGAVIVLHDISELDHLERIRRDFVANASHELKTPITAIRGLAETILDDANMPPETRHGFIERIHRQSLRLSSLVVDLMTISRLESDQSEQSFQSVNLSEAVRRSVSAARAACEQKQLTLTVDQVDDSVVVDGDIQGLCQLIDNLIDNAIKYTPAGGLISVRLMKDQATAELQVVDSGVGISPQHQQRIFERFYRVDKARSLDLGGTGLGLSIVKNIAQQHGGSVSLESKSGHGSTFTVKFPLSR